MCPAPLELCDESLERGRGAASCAGGVATPKLFYCGRCCTCAWKRSRRDGRRSAVAGRPCLLRAETGSEASRRERRRGRLYRLGFHGIATSRPQPGQGRESLVNAGGDHLLRRRPLEDAAKPV